MKRFVLFAIILIVACPAFAWESTKTIPNQDNGSDLLAYSETELTDAAATYNSVVTAFGYDGITVDVITDKGGTLVITPILNKDDETSLGKPSDTLTIADGGPSDRASYIPLSAPKAKILFTKTEAGTTSGFALVVRGTLGQ